ncbi:hypothetical protein [Metabacillus fastidiosus]|uniref:hypothetical protein n=1 Tax=Metabacillus fastidiosus TaxID=1458 RepID=UPI003D281AB8
MPEPNIKIKKIWEDIDFFKLHFELIGISCAAIIDIYTSNEELNDLREGMERFLTFQQNEFIWTSGADNDKITHFLSFRFFMQNKTGTVGLEIIADNKEEKPYRMRTNFFILTELGQADDFVQKLEQLIREEIIEFEGLYQ